MKKMTIMAIAMFAATALFSGMVSADTAMSVSTDRAEYSQGETVTITVTNNYHDPLMLTGYSVLDEAGELVYSPPTVAFAEMLNPGESEYYVWTQVAYCGNEVLPGVYTISIGQDSTEITILAPAEPSFTVETDRTEYAVGEDVLVEFTNTGDCDIYVASAYWVEDSAGEVIFAPRVPFYELPLVPGESTVCTWGQVDSQGLPVTAGTYTVCTLQGDITIQITEPAQSGEGNADDRVPEVDEEIDSQAQPIIKPKPAGPRIRC